MLLFYQKWFVFLCKKDGAHFQHARNICAKFQIDSLKTVGGVAYTNFLYSVLARNCKISKPKML